MQKPSRGKGNSGKIGDCPEVFNFHIERARQEKSRLLARQLDVDTSGVLKSFSHPSDKLHPLSYGVYCGDVADMLKLLPRKDYTLLIADIPYGFRLAGSINDEEPYKYAQLDKMVQDFAQLTTAPLWRILIFHSRDQTYSVTKALRNTCHAVEGLTW
jgi:hypothetical protein